MEIVSGVRFVSLRKNHAVDIDILHSKIEYRLFREEKNMGIFDLLNGPNINDGLKEYQAEKNAILLDVRENDEYAGGHIKGSVNLPLSRFMEAESMFEDKSVPIYTYCHSGGRSKRMAAGLAKLGFKKVVNIGGIMDYNGEIER